MKKAFVALMAVVILCAGCTGSFMLTKTVHGFHRSMDNKWVDEVLFLGCCWLPIYGLALVGDAIILNSVEFWTGDNPMESADASGPRVLTAGSMDITMTHNVSDDTILINIGTDSGVERTLVLSRSADGVSVAEAGGVALYSASADDNGGVSVYDAQGKLVRHSTADQVAMARRDILR